MSTLYAFCGLNCADCAAYVATREHDVKAQEKILAEWRIAYNSPDMPISAVTCYGCTATESCGGYCTECPVRACANQRGVETCAHCPDYGCEILEGFLQAAPEVRKQLEAIRASL